jgi:hypothetical protein
MGSIVVTTNDQRPPRRDERGSAKSYLSGKLVDDSASVAFLPQAARSRRTSARVDRMREQFFWLANLAFMVAFVAVGCGIMVAYLVGGTP